MGDLRPSRAQTVAAGRFRGCAGGGRALEPAAARGRSAGPGGGGAAAAAAGPGACARTSHSAARGRPLASPGRRAKPPALPAATRLSLRRVSHGCRPPGCAALAGPGEAGDEERAAAPHRVDAPPLPQPPEERASRGRAEEVPLRRPAARHTSARRRRGSCRAPGAAASPAPSEE